MSDLLTRLQAAKDLVAQLERECVAGPCREYGHEWRFLGGKNAGCGFDGCQCSVPVYQCRKCGDCDYGDNEEASDVIVACAANGRADT